MVPVVFKQNSFFLSSPMWTMRFNYLNLQRRYILHEAFDTAKNNEMPVGMINCESPKWTALRSHRLAATTCQLSHPPLTFLFKSSQNNQTTLGQNVSFQFMRRKICTLDSLFPRCLLWTLGIRFDRTQFSAAGHLRPTINAFNRELVRGVDDSGLVI